MVDETDLRLYVVVRSIGVSMSATHKSLVVNVLEEDVCEYEPVWTERSRVGAEVGNNSEVNGG